MRVVGRYALYGEIASGGMATVHFGRLLGVVGFAKTVAIKRLHAQLAKDPEFVSMFLDEARLAARIRHPNVVSTLDVVALHGELFLVMEYVQGDSLRQLVRAASKGGGRMPAAIAATILVGTLHGLHAAHEARSEQGQPLGIVHRDISPQNILVGTDGVPRVLDFGVAKAAGRAQTTREGQLKGKIAYMSPEQLMGRGVTRATDIFAASIVLWEALTGRRLFSGESEGEVVRNVLDAQIERPSKLVAGLSPQIDALVMRGLARDPAERFASAREMARALEKVMALAPSSDVGEFVEKIAAPALAYRAERIAKIESSSPVLGEISPDTGSPSASTWPLLSIPEAVGQTTGAGARTVGSASGAGLSAPALPGEQSSATNAIGAIVSDSGAVGAAGRDTKPVFLGLRRRVLVLIAAAIGSVCGALLLIGGGVVLRDRRVSRSVRSVAAAQPLPVPSLHAVQPPAVGPAPSASTAGPWLPAAVAEQETSPSPTEVAPVSSPAPLSTSHAAAGRGATPAARPPAHAHPAVSCDP
ncbi:MAG TPA: protein kinase, partial [Polyangiaceae bacterium]|nr:protein kinase [Polyangiaceae bacterium]